MHLIFNVLSQWLPLVLIVQAYDNFYVQQQQQKNIRKINEVKTKRKRIIKKTKENITQKFTNVVSQTVYEKPQRLIEKPKPQRFI